MKAATTNSKISDRPRIQRRATPKARSIVSMSITSDRKTAKTVVARVAAMPIAVAPG